MRLVLLPVYILILALFIFVLLFGQSAQFEGTVVQKAHWFITEGLCSCTGSVVVKVGGKRGQRMLDLFGEYYCDRPNPTLQVGPAATRRRASIRQRARAEAPPPRCNICPMTPRRPRRH